MNITKLGNKIQSFRKLLKMSQEDLSGESGVARRILQKLEAGRGNPTLSTLFSIADSLKVSPSSLVKVAEMSKKTLANPEVSALATIDSDAVSGVRGIAGMLEIFADASPARRAIVLSILCMDLSIAEPFVQIEKLRLLLKDVR